MFYVAHESELVNNPAVRAFNLQCLTALRESLARPMAVCYSAAACRLSICLTFK